MRFTALVAAITLIASVANATSVIIPVGDTEISIPVLDGFLEVCRRDADIRDVFSAGMPQTNTVIACFMTEGDWDDYWNAQGEEIISPYLIVQVLNESTQGSTPARFERFASNIKETQVRMWSQLKDDLLKPGGRADSTADALSRLAGIPVDYVPGTIVPLGVYEESAQKMSSLWLASSTLMIGEEVIAISQVQTSTALYVKGRILVIFAYRTRKTAADDDRIKTLTDKWIGAIMAENEPQ